MSLSKSKLSHIMVGTLMLVVFFALNITYVNAEDFSYGVANYISVKDTNVRNGQIVSSNNDGYFISTTPYDDGMIGIITTNPAITFVSSDSAKQAPVISSGNGSVLVSAANGALRKGDPITTSEVRGVGMKATRPGNIIGTALEDYNPKDKNQATLLPIKIDIKYYTFNQRPSETLFDAIKISLLTAANDQPPVFFKYFTSGFVVLATVLLGFYFFGRVAGKGIEALGRNPLASRMIQLGIIINVVITVATIASGLIIAVIILRL